MSVYFGRRFFGSGFFGPDYWGSGQAPAPVVAAASAQDLPGASGGGGLPEWAYHRARFDAVKREIARREEDDLLAVLLELV